MIYVTKLMWSLSCVILRFVSVKLHGDISALIYDKLFVIMECSTSDNVCILYMILMCVNWLSIVAFKLQFRFYFTWCFSCFGFDNIAQIRIFHICFVKLLFLLWRMLGSVVVKKHCLSNLSLCTWLIVIWYATRSVYSSHFCCLRCIFYAQLGCDWLTWLRPHHHRNSELLHTHEKWVQSTIF